MPLQSQTRWHPNVHVASAGDYSSHFAYSVLKNILTGLQISWDLHLKLAGKYLQQIACSNFQVGNCRQRYRIVNIGNPLEIFFGKYSW